MTPVAPTKRRFELGDEHVVTELNVLTNARRQYTLKVTFADDSRAEFLNGNLVYDQTGGLIKDRFGLRTPSKLIIPSELSVGKKWRTAYQLVRSDGTVENNFMDFQVVGYETIAIADKNIKTFLVVGKGEARPPGRIHVMDHRIWVDPESLRRIREDWSYSYNGNNRQHWIWETVLVKRVAG